MDKKALRQLSKNQLIQIILDYEERLIKVESLIKAYENPHTPSAKKRSKKNTERDESKPRFPGKPNGGNGGGVKMPAPDKEEVVEKEDCPGCGEQLGEPCDTYRFRQMDIPRPEFVTTRYAVNLYDCERCGAGVDAGDGLHKGFYGPNVTALLGSLKNEGLSYGAAARFVRDAYHLPITGVAVYNKLVKLAQVMSVERERIRRAINRAEFAHLDETGLRRDGKNGFVWGASTPKHCLFEYDPSRAASVAKRILADFDGAIITDDYKGYAWHDLRQLCWAHLLREAKEFSKKYDGAEAQYQRLKWLYDKAKRAQQLQDTTQYDTLIWHLEDIARCYHALDGCKTMHAKLHNRTHLWLLGAKLLNVPLTNNQAERCLRSIVLQRNRIGCIRNEKGEEFINTFLTCTTTWRMQEKNVYEQLLKNAHLT